MDDTKIANVAAEFVDKPFALGNKGKGFDCVNSLIEFYSKLGFDFPRTFGEWTEENYAKGWLRDPGQAKQVLRKFLMTLGREVDKNYLLRGDLLIIEPKTSSLKMHPKTEAFLREELEASFPGMKGYISNLLAGRELLSFPAIFLGNDLIMIVSNKGVFIVPFRFFEDRVVSCRRLIG